MNSFCKFALVFAILVIGSMAVSAKPWRGIVPFHSTRADAEQILGRAPCQDENGLGYEFDNEDVYFVLAPRDIPQSCATAISQGTVLRIERTPKKQVSISDLILTEGGFAVLSEAWSLYEKVLLNNDDGIVARTSKGWVDAIYFLPEKRDRILCEPYSPNPTALAQPIVCRLCPIIIFDSPEKIERGSSVVFTVKVSGLWRCTQTTYDWEVTVGRIVQGQGTTSINVDTSGVEDNRLIARVNVGGLDRSCASYMTASVTLVSRP